MSFYFEKIKKSTHEGFFSAFPVTGKSERRGDIDINSINTNSLKISVLVNICASISRGQLGKSEKI